MAEKKDFFVNQLLRIQAQIDELRVIEKKLLTQILAVPKKRAKTKRKAPAKKEYINNGGETSDKAAVLSDKAAVLRMLAEGTKAITDISQNLKK